MVYIMASSSARVPSASKSTANHTPTASRSQTETSSNNNSTAAQSNVDISISALIAIPILITLVLILLVLICVCVGNLFGLSLGTKKKGKLINTSANADDHEADEPKFQTGINGKGREAQTFFTAKTEPSFLTTKKNKRNARIYNETEQEKSPSNMFPEMNPANLQVERRDYAIGVIDRVAGIDSQDGRVDERVDERVDNERYSYK